MPTPPPPGDSRLAQRLTAYAVLAHDPAVPHIAADYWELSQDHYREIDDALAGFVAPDAEAAASYKEVLADPTAAGPQHGLRRGLSRLLARRPSDRDRLADLVAEADRHIWIDYHLGAEYTPQEAEPPAYGPATATPRPERPGVHIVIPFRDRDGGPRTRNLLACLRALADQDGGPGHRVTVVESDSEPRSRDLASAWADDYVFAPKDGLFNKAWTVNVGVVAGDGQAPLLCVLDADILVDRSFVARNAARFDDGTHGVHLPFRWSLSLDAPSTRRAIARRVVEGTADVPGEVLRGLLLREPPGGCVWLRAEVFHAVGGFDERFEGWGGEDDDVVARLSAAATLRRFDDDLLHLDHPRPAMTREDGQPFNAHIELMTWSAGAGYGDPAKFSRATG